MDHTDFHLQTRCDLRQRQHTYTLHLQKLPFSVHFLSLSFSFSLSFLSLTNTHFSPSQKESGKHFHIGQVVEVSVTESKDPQAEIVFTGTQQIPRKGDERTLIRFTLDESGQVLDLSTNPKTIVQRTGL